MDASARLGGDDQGSSEALQVCWCNSAAQYKGFVQCGGCQGQFALYEHEDLRVHGYVSHVSDGQWLCNWCEKGQPVPAEMLRARQIRVDRERIVAQNEDLRRRNKRKWDDDVAPALQRHRGKRPAPEGLRDAIEHEHGRAQRMAKRLARARDRERARFDEALLDPDWRRGDPLPAGKRRVRGSQNHGQHSPQARDKTLRQRLQAMPAAELKRIRTTQGAMAPVVKAHRRRFPMIESTTAYNDLNRVLKTIPR